MPEGVAFGRPCVASLASVYGPFRLAAVTGSRGVKQDWGVGLQDFLNAPQVNHLITEKRGFFKFKLLGGALHLMLQIFDEAR